MNRFRERFAQFMIGRYGADKLGQYMMGAGFAFIVAGLFTHNLLVDIGAFVCLILCYSRMFSKNIRKRFEENQKFERLRFQVLEQFRRWKFKLRQSREYHIYKCPGCGQKIRVPRGKGRISIHCPKCSIDFIKKS